MLTTEQLSHLQAQLHKQQDILMEHLKQNNHFNLQSESMQQSVGELSNYDNHPGDTASELYEREKDIALNEHAEKELSDIVDALHRMSSGDYGRCVSCGEPIPYDRLEAIPTTKYCAKHSPQQKHEENERPIEEEVLEPGYQKRADKRKGTNFFDGEDSWQAVARYGTSETPSDFSGQHIEHYNQAYINSAENVGSVEAYENFTGITMEGKEKRTYPNDQHKEYEQSLDEANEMSILGDLHDSRKDSYLEEE
ncbi:TraR/DksA C4-type zinc finger protein [Pontibacillus litoralis]|uniref:Zinc finger DksA/TraR C4-type domain-containing protein n=1 Tax=Pontibacillus litoralis JSM 072002 TaxID=1385512 RepID=A0A0A5G458_9BACI|nr:TraR/DksA C4-type zinc finger protein [Pontibacillus litoralis]KGX86839.1 hypothetical protein N784_03000 [Pontibacillus litoralis JSM 072002]